MLGRRQPSSEDLAEMWASMRSAGLPGGWLALMSASEHAEGPLEVLEVRRIGDPAGTFEETVEAMMARRR